MTRDDFINLVPVGMFIVVLLGVTASYLLQRTRKTHSPQTVLNLDEMARKWNATPTYFLATSNHVTVQDTTIYGVTTLRIDPK